MEENLNKKLVEQALSFHGLPLMKTWNDEKGNASLVALGLQPNSLDCSLYRERLKTFNYTDRAKRLRLHQFICSKSATLFRNYSNNSTERKIQKLLVGGGEQIPPMEYFSIFNSDERSTKFFMNLKPGDIAYGAVIQPTKSGLLIKILCTVGSSFCLVADLNLKGVVMPQNLISARDSKNIPRPFMANDFVCCEVLQISDQYPPIILGMTGLNERFDNGPPLGIISAHEMPQFYKIAIDQQNQGKTYNQILKDSESFKNPSAIDNLCSELGLDKTSYYTFMSKNKFPQDEYAKDLRQQQNSKIAFRSVAEGIGHFKEGRHEEAFQCLNKALTIDPRNVEGLVARGALNANSGRFQKAIVDFEAALKLNASHNNAKKYLGETLLAHGRSLEEELKFEEAQKAYIDCLNVNPHHQEALASLNYIKTKINSRKIVEPAELELPPLNLGGSISIKEPKGSKDEVRSKKAKKDKKKRGKKRRSSSSESSSSDSESSDSSSESSDNSSSTSDSDSRSKKRNKKRKSASPAKPENVDTRYGQSSSFDPMDEHELKVKKFLEMSRDEDDYEEKVGQLIAEASKYQKSKQDVAKGSKKKKKSEKKVKKDKKKRKKDDKKKGKEPDIDEIREALKMFENFLPDKLKKLYQEKIKEDESRQKGNESADNNMNEEKWKMKFSKSESDTKPKKANNFSLYDSDDEEQARKNHAPSQPAYTATSTMSFTKAPSPKIEIAPVPAPLLVNQGPVVLDKFGNFRRVVDPSATPLPLPSDSRRSRSKDRRRSRSDSRSPRRQRSRSWRRFSRSRSRSYSRSPGRGNRGGNSHRSRARGYSPPSRGRPNYRGNYGGGGKFTRDFRNNDFRDRRGGGRGGRFGGGRYERRSYSRSPEPRRMSRSPDRKDH